MTTVSIGPRVAETQLGEADALGAAFARGDVDLRAVYDASILRGALEPG